MPCGKIVHFQCKLLASSLARWCWGCCLEEWIAADAALLLVFQPISSMAIGEQQITSCFIWASVRAYWGFHTVWPSILWVGRNTCSGIDHQLLCPNIHIHVFCIYIIVIEQNHIFIAHFITATKWKSYGERKESPTRSRFSCSLWGGAEPQRQTGSFHSGRRVPDTAPEGSLQKGNDTSKMPVVPLPRICIQMILTMHSRWNATRFRQRMRVTYVQQKLLFFFVVVMIMCDSALLVIVG